jgi:hypothetical protein
MDLESSTEVREDRKDHAPSRRAPPVGRDLPTVRPLAWLSDQRALYLKAHPETWDALMRLVPPEIKRSSSTAK